MIKKPDTASLTRAEAEKPARLVPDPKGETASVKPVPMRTPEAVNMAANAMSDAGPAAQPEAAPEPQPQPQAKPQPKPQAQPQQNLPPVRPAVAAGRLKRRHYGVIISFLLMVLLPTLVSAWYLWMRAADQYDSTVGFSVRTEETSSALALLGGITNLSSASSSDSDILYEFIQSQKLVTDMDADLDLRAIWSWPKNDPVYTYDAPGSIEELVDYWKRMVSVSYDTSTSLIEVRVLAFRPEDATAIARSIQERSSAMINDLNDIAREDAIRYAREDLDTAVERLKSARRALTLFRNQNQIVDPEADIQIQVGLLSTLQAQLAEALIEQELLRETTRENDPRIAQFTRRVRVIERQIEEERGKLGIGSSSLDGGSFATVVGEYEGLIVDREFAEQTYTAALVAYDQALTEARRQSRYLAAYIEPTLSEEAQYPQRGVTLFVLGMFLFLLWGILVLVFYALKDRR